MRDKLLFLRQGRSIQLLYGNPAFVDRILVLAVLPFTGKQSAENWVQGSGLLGRFSLDLSRVLLLVEYRRVAIQSPP